MKLNKHKYTVLIVVAAAVVLLSAMGTVLILQQTKHIHTFGNWEMFKQPTCSDYGIERRFCECGEMQEKRNDKVDHVEGEWIVNTETNEKVLSCSVCGKHIKIESLDNHTHSYGEWITTVEPTCSTGGVMTRTCRCGAVEEKAIETSKHEFGDWTVERESTCTEKGVMVRLCKCGAKEEKDIALASHRYGDWVIEYESTCTRNGLESRYCECGAKDEKYLPLGNHKYENWIVEYESTCTRNGLKVRYCECGAKDEKEIPLSDHVFGEWVEIKQPECGVFGIMERACICGEKEQKNTHALEHEFSAWTVENKATCTISGTEKRSCKHCGEGESRTISPLGHGNTYSKLLGITVNICCERCDAVLDSQRIEDSKGLAMEGSTLTGIGSCLDDIVVIPSGTTSIAQNAFANSSVKVVVLPSSIKMISARAFSNCKELKEIYMEPTVTKIDFWAFQFYSNLTKIHFNGTKSQWNAIDKIDQWDNYCGNYTIICTDGIIEK